MPKVALEGKISYLINDLQNTIFEIIDPQGSVVSLNHVAALIILKFAAELSSNMIPRWGGGLLR